jgi:hypothetical protein
VLDRFLGGNAEEETLDLRGYGGQGQAGIRSVFPFLAFFLLSAIPDVKM